MSTIDYVFYRQSVEERVLRNEMMDCLSSNVSHDYPILCTLNIQLNAAKPTSVAILPPFKIRWEKVDKMQYEEIVTGYMPNVKCGSTSLGALDAEIRKLNQILVKAFEHAGPARVVTPRRAKLKTWTPEIKQAIQNKKRAFKEWKLASRPNDIGNMLIMNKKLTTSNLRRPCRVESARCSEQIRQQILNAKSSDMKLFYRLVNKQRGKLKHCVNELSVVDTVYKSENEILTAWRQNFEAIATPVDYQDFDKE